MYHYPVKQTSVDNIYYFFGFRWKLLVKASLDTATELHRDWEVSLY